MGQQRGASGLWEGRCPALQKGVNLDVNCPKLKMLANNLDFWKTLQSE